MGDLEARTITTRPCTTPLLTRPEVRQHAGTLPVISLGSLVYPEGEALRLGMGDGREGGEGEEGKGGGVM